MGGRGGAQLTQLLMSLIDWGVNLLAPDYNSRANVRRLERVPLCPEAVQEIIGDLIIIRTAIISSCVINMSWLELITPLEGLQHRLTFTSDSTQTASP